jgi:hypothetical protein
MSIFFLKSTKISMSVFLNFFVSSRFWVCLGDVSSKTLQKTFCKQLCGKPFFVPISAASLHAPFPIYACAIVPLQFLWLHLVLPSAKNRQKNPKPISLDFSITFLSRFRVFLREGSSKTRQKSQNKSDQPWYFFGLRGTNQARQGQGPSSVFFLSAPCQKQKRNGRHNFT